MHASPNARDRRYVKATAKVAGLVLDSKAGVEKLRAESRVGRDKKSGALAVLDKRQTVETAVFAFRKPD